MSCNGPLGLICRLTDGHRNWGWILLTAYAPVEGAFVNAGLKLRGGERAH